MKFNVDINKDYRALQSVKQFVLENDNYIILGSINIAKIVQKILNTRYNKTILGFVNFGMEDINNNDQFNLYTLETIPENTKLIIASYRAMVIAKELETTQNLSYGNDFIFFNHIAMFENEMQLDGFGEEFTIVFNNNKEKFVQTYELLSDNFSKNMYEKVLNFRANAFNTERLSLNDLPMSIDDQIYYEENSEKYIDKLSPQLSESLRKNVAFKISLDAYSYKDIVKPENAKCIINAGAYNNTSLMFTYMANDAKIFAFEPQEEIHKQNLEIAEIYHNIKPVNRGLWSETTKLHFNVFEQLGSTTGSSICEDGEVSIDVYALDDFKKEYIIDKVDFIKMDIEGSEIEALNGAKNLIQKDKPDLAISIYHKATDLFEIPLLIKSIVPEYKIFIDHKYYDPNETVCFATIK